MWLVAGSLMTLAGCLDAGSVSCADGSLCADGTRCLVGGGCATSAQDQACEGLAETDPCDVGGARGFCRDGACDFASCGDMALDPGEACDDGNQLSGDGCSFDCRSNEVCGNGILDPAEACDCGADATTQPARCDAPNADTVDAACRLDCRATGCGNGEVEAGEVCDDGNQDSNDGCAFNCLSDETCGNGVVDNFAGEACDDGNTRGRDGCASTCVEEPLRWEQQGVPRYSVYSSMAYDPRRNKVVLFGGYSCCESGRGEQTYEYDGASWTEVSTLHAPSGRWDARMAYDAVNQQILLFGGDAVDGNSRDTWSYDGADWTLLHPATSPPRRYAQAMASDLRRGEVVMFGGFGTLGNLADTWAWDGVTWHDRSGAVTPAARHEADAAYDPIADRVVMFGGIGDDFLDDTWIWDGTGWTEANLVGARPSARTRPAMTFDAGRGVVAMFGGYEGNFGAFDDLWEWNGTAWSERPSGVAPAARFGAAMTYDQAHGELVLFGGRADPTFEDTWRRRAATPWTEVASAVPPPRFQAVMAYDPVRSRLVVFGGTDNYGDLHRGDTWVYDGAWRELLGAGPPPTVAATMAYDPVGDRMVLFGGDLTETSLDDFTDETWVLEGDAWRLLPTVTRPPERGWHAMASDPVHGGVIVYGGLNDLPDDNDHFLGDAWALAGDTWTQLATPGAAPRGLPALAYDPLGERVVLFGGSPNLDLIPTPGFDDTWALVGDTWTELQPVERPTPRYGSTLSYDATTGALIMFGGRSPTDLNVDTWSLVGDVWTELTPATAPSPREKFVTAYDAVRQRTVMFGGIDNGAINDVWTLAYRPVAPPEACSSGEDLDGDGAMACADDDCWALCTPVCGPPAETAGVCDPSAATCGDTTCSAIEDCRVCETDCGVCAAVCGDARCEGGESAATCPGDCP